MTERARGSRPATRQQRARRPGDGREYLDHVVQEINSIWRLGRNAIVGWRPTSKGLEVLAVPQYLLANLLSNHEDLLVGGSAMSKERLRIASEVCEIEPYKIVVPAQLRPRRLSRPALEQIVSQYSIIKKRDIAVGLIDIVEFSKYSPLKQVTALNSLSYSINIAYRRVLEQGFDISLAYTTTGDGYYIWNRKPGFEANLHLFCVLMLVLIDNVLGANKGTMGTVPQLRAGFHVGGCYEYFQAKGFKPGTSSFIVGDVTIECARIMEKALPSQILVGNFATPANSATDTDRSGARVDVLEFIDVAQERLREFAEVSLARERITEIKCYLTGERQAAGGYSVSRFVVQDKHGLRHEAFNLKLNVHRRRGLPVYIGRQSSDLESFDAERADVALSGSAGPAGAGADRERARGSPRGHVLVVDDDPNIRHFIATLLRQQGHDVLEAGDGEAAREVVDGAARLDVVVADVVMPGRLDGPALAAYSCENRPGLQIIYVSGYARSLGGIGDQPERPLIRKPIDTAEFLQTVESAVAAAREQRRAERRPGAGKGSALVAV